MISDVAKFISLTLTVPTLALSLWVVWVYGAEAKEALKRLLTGHRITDTQLLIAGITIGFVGSFLDNIYWGLAWSAAFFELPQERFLFRNGVFANIPFRQGAGVLAASLHLIAAMRHSPGGKRLYALIWALTFVSAFALWRSWVNA